ncbi:glycine zipper 2TM domain-containing protein [Lysobacter auxotrophicus]|uniref:Glycine zipper 2TM domain-containing protein n=1 Tax=Lysobacter auxotrophicus TaxID=2992573 RepID=A0ABM8DG99_9GAMM|nr:glycine zipper 2TM domain-containing protein [Lysobacter auxotrophicus]BDU17631.1 glycine zipper 2TM domain-containing protein [Lysobacter auxotrophicus]
MIRLIVASLALAAAASGPLHAQSYPQYGSTSSSDYARVVRVDPVFDRYDTAAPQQRCYERPTYVGGDGYRNDGYRNDGYYGGDSYGSGYPTGGSQAGRTVSTIVGTIVGAAVGSQIGGGSARYATSAIGSVVGGMAGRQIYDQSQNQRERVGTVRVCDPVYEGDGYYSSRNGSRNAGAYDVTYEYAGRTYTTRTNYDPGDRIRVRVNVTPE